MTDRAERLGLEPGSTLKPAELRKVPVEKCELPTTGEIAHSIAISLKRIADHADRMCPILTEYFGRRMTP